LKVNNDEPLSDFAFKFNLRRYTMVVEFEKKWVELGFC
jgi:hypothetical protein